MTVLLQVFFLSGICSQPVDEANSRVDSLIRVGINHFSSQPNEAIRFFQESFRLSEEAGYTRGKARSYHLIAQLLLKQGMQDSVLQLLTISNALYQQVEDSTSRGKIMLSLGDVYLQKGDYKLALKQYT
ncbi:MAG: tetratricopeptide repeat protein, partial [Cyclobacteriaceae bacterium]